MLSILKKSIIVTIVMVMLFSCENSMTKVREIAMQDTLIAASTYEIIFERSDSGFVQARMESPVMMRYGGSDPYSEFPDGFEVFFFDNDGKQTSHIKANYGISYDKRKFINARNDVVVKNLETQEELYTENLVWDQRKKEIRSNTFVKLVSPDKTIFGDSMWANESFTQRNIFNIKGEIEIEDDTTSMQ